jgi:hypothetical protein
MLRACSEYGAKSRIAPTETTGVYSFVLHLVCAVYGLKTLGVTSVEIGLKLLYLKPNSRVRKRYFRQVMKFMSLRTTCSLSVQYMGYKEGSSVLTLQIQRISDE